MFVCIRVSVSVLELLDFPSVRVSQNLHACLHPVSPTRCLEECLCNRLGPGQKAQTCSKKQQVISINPPPPDPFIVGESSTHPPPATPEHVSHRRNYFNCIHFHLITRACPHNRLLIELKKVSDPTEWIHFSVHY